MGRVILLLAFTATTLASWLSIHLARVLALRYGMLDVPNARSSHVYPVPLGGGLAMVLVGIATVGIVALIHPDAMHPHELIFIAGALVISGVSLVDDVGHVPSAIRLAGQGAAAGIVIVGYGYWHAIDLPLLGAIALGGFGIVLTGLWVVGLTNAFNFMDGLDGLAAGQAVAASFGWTILGWQETWPLLEAAGLLLAAISLGFLLHNWHPAKIFMGDVGSTFLGYSFAVLDIVAARYDVRLASAGVVLMWPVIFDTGFTVLNRLRRRENIFAGHREFLFHRLVATGWTHDEAATLYFTFPILGAVLALTWDRGTPPLRLGTGLALAGLCLSLWLLVRQQERKVGRASVSILAAGVPRAWDGAERRSGLDRRGGGRDSQWTQPTDRRTGCGRRVTDRASTVSGQLEPSGILLN